MPTKVENHSITNVLRRYEVAPSPEDEEYLVKRCWAPLVYWAVLTLKANQEAAEEFAQSAMQMALKKLQQGTGNFENRKPFRAYMRTVVRNAWRKSLSKEAKLPIVELSSTSAVSRFDPSEIVPFIEKVSRIVDRLTPRERDVLNAVIIGDQKADLEQRFGLTRFAVRAVLERIKGVLSNIAEDVEDEGQPILGRPPGTRPDGSHLAGASMIEQPSEQLIKEWILGDIDNAVDGVEHLEDTEDD